jgi:hypothetical protein
VSTGTPVSLEILVKACVPLVVAEWFVSRSPALLPFSFPLSACVSTISSFPPELAS